MFVPRLESSKHTSTRNLSACSVTFIVIFLYLYSGSVCWSKCPNTCDPFVLFTTIFLRSASLFSHFFFFCVFSTFLSTVFVSSFFFHHIFILYQIFFLHIFFLLNVFCLSLLRLLSTYFLSSFFIFSIFPLTLYVMSTFLHIFFLSSFFIFSFSLLSSYFLSSYLFSSYILSLFCLLSDSLFPSFVLLSIFLFKPHGRRLVVALSESRSAAIENPNGDKLGKIKKSYFRYLQ